MNRKSKIWLLTGFILCLAGIVGYFYPQPQSTPGDRILLNNAGGRVVFTHAAHSKNQNYGPMECKTCHHDITVSHIVYKYQDDSAVFSCSACHGSAEQEDFNAKHQALYSAAAPDSCKRCHHTVITGYSKAWDHEAHKTYTGDDCASCHHDTPFTMKDGTVAEREMANCSTCHKSKADATNTVSLKTAGHAKCASCHAEWFDDKKQCQKCHSFARPTVTAAVDNTACSNCHAPILSRKDSLHQRCMGCHDSKSKGPGEKAPCVQCHAPAGR